MKTIAAQYLEYAPPDATPAKVRQRLREAFEIVPLSLIILGWDLPPRLEDAVAEECSSHHAALYRWHPLLASDAGFALPLEWQPVSSASTVSISSRVIVHLLLFGAIHGAGLCHDSGQSPNPPCLGQTDFVARPSCSILTVVRHRGQARTTDMAGQPVSPLNHPAARRGY